MRKKGEDAASALASSASAKGKQAEDGRKDGLDDEAPTEDAKPSKGACEPQADVFHAHFGQTRRSSQGRLRAEEKAESELEPCTWQQPDGVGEGVAGYWKERC